VKSVLSALVLVVLVMFVQPSHAWQNGYGSGMDVSCSKCYGTHDFLAEHALAFLPFGVAYSWLYSSISRPNGVFANEEYLYGTEIPDLGGVSSEIGTVFKSDYSLHAVYFTANGSVEDDYAARRAQESYDTVIHYLRIGALDYAARWMGITSHYVTDVTSYRHVMGKGKDWIKASPNGLAYENWVNQETSTYNKPFSSCLVYDGNLEHVAPYDVTMKLAYDTTFDTSGKGRTASWMEANYDPTSPYYRERVCESLNLATNALADLIYSTTLDTAAATSTVTTSASSSSNSAPTSLVPLTTSTVTKTVLGTTAIVSNEPFPYLVVAVVAAVSLALGAILTHSRHRWSSRSLSTPAVSPARAEKKFCIQCGAENPHAFKYCGKCGIRLEEK